VVKRRCGSRAPGKHAGEQQFRRCARIIPDLPVTVGSPGGMVVTAGGSPDAGLKANIHGMTCETHHRSAQIGGKTGCDSLFAVFS
jgi:hypothetical protein